jgi:acetylornithine/N-succinyldiaminopimelate aminotransferase
VQGEGGIRDFPMQSLKRLRQLCDERGLLLIFDEVQCGIGRTGKLFAYEWAGVEPDLMAIAKGIGGGFPMGACLATDEAAKGMTAGVHGTTFGGNPLAMAVGNAVLDVVLEPGFLDEVNRKALLFKQGLAAVADEYPQVIEGIRGSGLMLGLKCAMPNGKVNMALRDQHLLAVPAGDNVIRLLPPLTVTDAEIQDALARIRAAAKGLAEAASAAAE